LTLTKAGTYNIAARATDSSDTQRTVFIQITVIDTTPPNLSVTNPLPYTTITTTDGTTVTGTSFDDGTRVQRVDVKTSN